MLRSSLTDSQLDILRDAFHRQRGGENLTDIAKSHNISRKTLYTWRKHKDWLAEEVRLNEEVKTDMYKAIWGVLEDRAYKGSERHMALYFNLVHKQQRKHLVEDENAFKDGVGDDVFADLDDLLKQ